MIKKLHNETEKLNRLDAVGGDGDTGAAFSRAADTLVSDSNAGKLQFNRPSALFRRFGLIAESRMGGTCGASKINQDDWIYIVLSYFCPFVVCSLQLLQRLSLSQLGKVRQWKVSVMLSMLVFNLWSLMLVFIQEIKVYSIHSSQQWIL